MTQTKKFLLSAKKRAFTLLEIMLVIALLALSGSVIGINLRKALQKKKLSSSFERAKIALVSAQRLALTTQTDWHGVLKKRNDGWTLFLYSEEKQLAPLLLEPCQILLNGKEVQDQLLFEFFSSGYTQPEGSLLFSKNNYRMSINLIDLLRK